MADYLHPDSGRLLGSVRDHDVVREVLSGCDAVIHLAVVGAGQSMYEIERYSSVNVVGTAVLLEEITQRRDQIAKLIVASSISVYGDGAYRTATGEFSYPAPAPLRG